MENFVFLICSSQFLTIDDYKNLRKLYSPIVGVNSILIYEYLYDLLADDKKKLFNVEEVCKWLQINISIFNDSMHKLEAVGLICSYLKNDKSTYLYNLFKPSDIESFNKNPLLKSHLVKVIGQVEYDKIYFESKQKFVDKSNFINISKKYQDVFSNNFEENIVYDDEFTTIDLVIDTFETHDENISKLASSQFIKYLMKRNPSYYETQLINSLLKLGFTDASINLFIDFSVKFNNQINCPYISTIANDFRNRSIIHFNDVKHEISIIEDYKLRKNSSNNIKKTNEIVSTDKNSISITKELSIEDIFSDEDLEGFK